MSDDRDADDLEQRVDELEETVRKMLPNRRDVLKGGAAAAALGAAGVVGRESVEPARAAQGDQGLGTPTDPWPATYTEYLGGGNADLHVDADSVETDKEIINQGLSRPLSVYNPQTSRSPEINGGYYLKRDLSTSGSVIDGSMVSDKSADNGTADPFVRWNPNDGKYHCFVESLSSDGTGDISHFTSVDLKNWTYDQIVLDEGSSHLAYPLTFKWDGTWTMTPHRPDNTFYIYEATNFPTDWSLVESQQIGPSSDRVSDPTVFFYGGRWYLLYHNNTPDTLLWYADKGKSLTGRSWTEHPASPILTQSSDDVEGPAGRPIVVDNSYADVFSQTNTNEGLRVHRLTNLSDSSVTVSELSCSPLIEPQGGGWNGTNVHHIDWVTGGPTGHPQALVDGRGTGNWEIGVYQQGDSPPTKFRAGLSSGYTIGGPWDQIPFDDVKMDPGGHYDTTNNQYVCPTAGTYKVKLHLQYVSGSVDDRFLAMTRTDDGSTTDDKVMATLQGSSQGNTTFESTREIDVGEGDQLRFYGGQSTGTSVDVAAPHSFVTVERVS